MGEWWQSRWIRRHVMFVPFGVFITTGLLAYITEPGPWEIKTSLSPNPPKGVGKALEQDITGVERRPSRRIWDGRSR